MAGATPIAGTLQGDLLDNEPLFLASSGVLREPGGIVTLIGTTVSVTVSILFLIAIPLFIWGLVQLIRAYKEKTSKKKAVIKMVGPVLLAIVLVLLWSVITYIITISQLG